MTFQNYVELIELLMLKEKIQFKQNIIAACFKGRP